MSSAPTAAAPAAVLSPAPEATAAERHRRRGWLQQSGEYVEEDEDEEPGEGATRASRPSAPTGSPRTRSLTSTRWKRASLKAKRRAKLAQRAGASAAEPDELEGEPGRETDALEGLTMAEAATWATWARMDRGSLTGETALSPAAAARALLHGAGGEEARAGHESPAALLSADSDGSPSRSGRSLWGKLVEQKRSLIHAAAFLSGGARVREMRPFRPEELADQRQAAAVLTPATKWKALKANSKAGGYVQAAKRRLWAVKGAREEFDADAEDEDAEYWRQGDAALHTREIWELRMDLHGHVEVVEELHKWWLVLRATFAPRDHGTVRAGWEGLVMDDYCKWQMRLYKALIAPFDKRDAKKCARVDWHIDRHGQPTLGRLAIYDAMFQLCDLWTRGISVDEYVAFLRILHDAVVSSSGVLKPLSAISCTDVAAEAALWAAEEAEEREQRSRRGALAARKASGEDAARDAAAREDAALAAAKAAAAAAAATAAAEKALLEAERTAEMERRLEEEANQRLAGLVPRGAFTGHYGVPADVMAQWGARALKPARDHFVTPRHATYTTKQAVPWEGWDGGAQPQLAPANGPRRPSSEDTVRAGKPAVPKPPARFGASRTTPSGAPSDRQQLSKVGSENPSPRLLMSVAQPTLLDALWPGSNNLGSDRPPSSLLVPRSAHGAVPQGRLAASLRPQSARVVAAQRLVPGFANNAGPKGFRPNSAREPGGRRAVPPGAMAMQVALMRNAPQEMRIFYTAQPLSDRHWPARAVMP